MEYAKIEKKILKAVKDRFCTFGQIKRALDAGRKEPYTHDDVHDVIAGMLAERKLASPRSGTITAYFLPSKIPSRFWLDGTGRVGMEFNEQSPVAFVPTRLDDVVEPFMPEPLDIATQLKQEPRVHAKYFCECGKPRPHDRGQRR